MEPSKVLFQHMDRLGGVGNKSELVSDRVGVLVGIFSVRNKENLHDANRATVGVQVRLPEQKYTLWAVVNFHHEIAKLCSTRKPKGFWHSCLHRSSPSHLNPLQSY